MKETTILTAEDTEILGELINISFGMATALIADMFESFATLHVPYVEIINVSDLSHFVTQKVEPQSEYFLASQMFKGVFEGEALFFVAHQSALNLVTLLYRINEIQEDGSEINGEDIKGAILEISNIVNASCMGKLAELLKTSVQFNAPSIEHHNDIRVLFDDERKQYDKVIVIQTILEFKDENIKGYLLILTNNQSFNWLQQALRDFMDND